MATIPSAIHLAAPLALDLTQSDGLPTRFSGPAYAGGMVPSYGVVIDLATTTVAARMPVLDSHDRSEVIGVIDAAEVGTAINVRGRLFSDLEDCAAHQIAMRARRGAPYQMSVGLYGYTETSVPIGQSVRVNGRDFAGPVTVLKGGKVREVSIVALGADHEADAKFFGQGTSLNQLAAQIAALNVGITRLMVQTGAARAAPVPGMAPGAAAPPAHGRPAVLSASEIYARRRREAPASAALLDLGEPAGAADEGRAPSALGLDAADIYARRRHAAARGGSPR